MFKLDDIVRVKTQPKMQPYVKIEGITAIITEIQGDYCTIQELKSSGELGGTGAVELSCLEKLED